MIRGRRRLGGPGDMAGMVGLWGASSLIRSVQYGIVVMSSNASATATIAAVDRANSVVMFLGTLNNDVAAPGTPFYFAAIVALTNATTVTAARYTAAGTGENVGFCVIEFAPGVVKSLQSVALSNVSASGAQTAAITRVDPAKTLIVWDGQSTTQTGTISNSVATVQLTDGVTITSTKSGISTTTSVDNTVQLLEFY